MGHLAIKLGAAMGYQMVAISFSINKREEALDLGASEFYAFHPVKLSEDIFRPLKHLILCGNVGSDYQMFVLSGIPHSEASISDYE